MRLPGEGTIYQRRDGRWVASIVVNKTRYTRYARGREEAVRRLHELRAALMAGTLARPTPRTLTLAAYLDEWLAAASAWLRPSTVESYGQLIRRVQPLGSLRLSQVERRHLAALYATLTRAGLSAGRVLKLHRVMHKALGDAVRAGLIGRNPAADLDPPRPQAVPPTLWTLEQIRAFLAGCAADDRPDSRLLSFLLLSGLRLGEALALRWRDLDLGRGVVQVERSVTHVAGRPVEGPPKTRAGVRRLTLPPEAVAVLRRQHAQQRQQRPWERTHNRPSQWSGRSDGPPSSCTDATGLGGTPTLADEQRVWTTAVGTVPLRGNVRRSLHRLCDRLGLPRIRVHDLRHLHATLLVAGGVDVKTAQRRLGHASLHLTLSVYTRALPESDRQAASQLSRLLQGGEG